MKKTSKILNLLLLLNITSFSPRYSSNPLTTPNSREELTVQLQMKFIKINSRHKIKNEESIRIRRLIGSLTEKNYFKLQIAFLNSKLLWEMLMNRFNRFQK